MVGTAHGRAGEPAPGELVMDLILSLDGCAAGEGWPGWWGRQSQEYLDWLAAQPESITLLGATTYRLMAGMAQQAGQLDVSDEGKESFAEMGRAPKVVFSSTLREPLDWANTTLVASDAAQAVSEMKAEASAPLVLSGSLRLGHSLMRAGLVDRFRVVLFPVITGRTGLERIWEVFEDYSLELLTSRTFEGGLQLLEYAPTHLERPPATDWDREAAVGS